MSIDDVPLGAVLDELAGLYETVAALPPVVERPGAKMRTVPGPRIPPGVTDLLDADERARAIRELDDCAGFLTRVLLDEGMNATATTVPGQLRFAALWSGVIDTLDTMLAYALHYDVREHLATFRRLARRGTRIVRTGSTCLDVTCAGQYVAAIDGPEVDGDLVCDRCRDRVPREQWERWGSRSEWVTPERAARMLGVTVAAVKMRASRGEWQRTGIGRNVRYLTADVMADRESAQAV